MGEIVAKKGNIIVLIFTDGRGEYFSRMFKSFSENVKTAHIPYIVVVDDSGDREYAAWLDSNYGKYVNHIEHHRERLGFGGTICDAWQKLQKLFPQYEYVFHLEDDFVFYRPVHLENLIFILEKNKNMAQVCLLRQPWSYEEKVAGGVWQQFPDRFTEKSLDSVHGKIYYLYHEEWFSTNPSLYPRWVVELGWPEGLDSEERFWNEKLVSRGNYSCAYFGMKTDLPVVDHIGYAQIGIKY